MTEEQFNSTGFHKGMTARLRNCNTVYYIMGLDFNDNYIGLHEDKSFECVGDSSDWLKWVKPSEIACIWRDLSSSTNT